VTAAPVRDVRPPEPAESRTPRLGFLGVGWIGRSRLHAIARSGLADIAAVCDASIATAREACREIDSEPYIARTFDDLLDQDLEGVVIATPSALHAEQAIAALEQGVAVFCQKPLARTADETRQVVAAARAADRLLGVDLSYRHTAGMRAIRDLVRRGELGTLFAVDLVFHNAYGPDKPWFRDPALSGGGCVIDLGIHLVDLALWTLDFPVVRGTTSRLYTRGVPHLGRAHDVEDYAVARLDLETGVTVQLACSWNLSAGRDAMIGAAFYGTAGAAALHNVDGSFYDFAAEQYRGTSRLTLAEPPDEWGGRAAIEWAGQLAEGGRFDAAAVRLVDVAAAIDSIYER
jgi:predicted dehydrogenase